MLSSFMNPFGILDEIKLYCLSSGAETSSDMEGDVLVAEQSGEEAVHQAKIGEEGSFLGPSKMDASGDHGRQ